MNNRKARLCVWGGGGGQVIMSQQQEESSVPFAPESHLDGRALTGGGAPESELPESDSSVIISNEREFFF